MKVAECRVKDPACGVSRRLASFAIRDAAAGKNEAAIRADLDKWKFFVRPDNGDAPK